jgi:hypothetical protein
VIIMSFQEEWILPEPVETLASDDLVARVRLLLPDDVLVSIRGQGDDRTIDIVFEADRVEAIASKLSAREGQLDWEWRADMDPPMNDGTSYDVHIDIVDDKGPTLRIYSNDGANRAAWPIVFSIASSLAEQLGALADEDSPPSSDRIPIFIEPPGAGRGRGGSSKPN